jgi:hypothetical protein
MRILGRYNTGRVTQWYSRLRQCTTSRKVTGSIPDGVIRIFHWHIISGCTMALGSTQPLTEMSTRNISWGGRAASAYGWQPYHLHVPIVLKFGSLNLLEPSGPVQACNGIALPFTIQALFGANGFTTQHLRNWVKSKVQTVHFLPNSWQFTLVSSMLSCSRK